MLTAFASLARGALSHSWSSVTLTTKDAPQVQMTMNDSERSEPWRYPQSAKPSRSRSITIVIYQNREKKSFIVIGFFLL